MSHTAQQPETDAEEAVASPADPEETEAAAADEAKAEETSESESGKPEAEESETVESKAVEGEVVEKKRRRLPRVSLDDRVTAVVVLLALTASIVTAAFLWRAYAGASDELAGQQQVRTRSAEVVTAFLLYDKDDLGGWEKRLTDLAAPDYRTAVSGAIKLQEPLITQLKASSEVAVRDVFVNDFDGPVAKAVVVADSQIVSDKFVRTVTGMRLLVELQRQGDGAWLLSGLGVLGIDEEAFTDPSGNPVNADDIEVPAIPGAEDGS
ncbi:hypothetical protein [Actinocorallia sp. A-T 12471]|uniref:hypothetical protein n=1 Tax=Actinocorallia sp. A-T 12471 TaxID=3089813 RepID=UPI0029D31176|nr:hypothetical protein [Actinocorallia sp. A-T 12471]MDX6741357.1 hypothetical protein [Actinocorallia sp. A-T 12471]